MSISVQWDDPNQSRMRINLQDRWDWLSLRKKMRLAFAMMNRVGHRVDIIFDLTHSDTIPGDPMLQMAAMQPYMPAHSAMVVFVSTDESLTEMFRAVDYVYSDAGMRALRVQTIEQAHLLIDHERHMSVSGGRY